MKIGIGITTFRRPEVFAKSQEKWLNMLPDYEHIVFIKHDSEPPQGIAHSKNACLRKLIEFGCDYIFIFDDDIYPLQKEWYKPFIEAKKHGIHHLTYTFEDGLSKIIGHVVDYPIFNTPKGCLMYFTKECLETCGGFDERFGIYGGEHIELSHRVYKLGMNRAAVISLPNIRQLFYAMDFEEQIQSSLSQEEKGNAMATSNRVLGEVLINATEFKKVPL